MTLNIDFSFCLFHASKTYISGAYIHHHKTNLWTVCFGERKNNVMFCVSIKKAIFGWSYIILWVSFSNTCLLMGISLLHKIIKSKFLFLNFFLNGLMLFITPRPMAPEGYCYHSCPVVVVVGVKWFGWIGEKLLVG